MTIDDLNSGQWAVVEKVGGEGSTRLHFLDMGLIPGTALKFVERAPMGDPVQIIINGYALSLRKDDAADIEVTLSDEPAAVEVAKSDIPYNVYLHDHNAHPGLGEGGRYHSKDHENPLPKGSKLTFALAGQQNCG